MPGDHDGVMTQARGVTFRPRTNATRSLQSTHVSRPTVNSGAVQEKVMVVHPAGLHANALWAGRRRGVSPVT